MAWPMRTLLVLLLGATAASGLRTGLRMASAPPSRTGVVKLPSGYALHYELVRPMPKTSQQRPPLVVLHGGPGVPHNYLKGLADLDYRSVVSGAAYTLQWSAGLAATPTQPPLSPSVALVALVALALLRPAVVRSERHGNT